MADMTATEVLIAAMEDFGECDPRSVMVIFTNAEDEVVCHSNVRRCEGLGMLEVAREMVLKCVEATSDGS